jgi:hypothetical protein
MSNEAEKWEKLKEELMDMKFHESESELPIKGSP